MTIEQHIANFIQAGKTITVCSPSAKTKGLNWKTLLRHAECPSLPKAYMECAA